MNARKYTKILNEALLGTLSDHNIPIDGFTFQQDNDPKHTANVSRRWLESHNIRVLPWPARTPEMNIIEHVWELIDQRIRQRPHAARSLDELWEWIQQEWYSIPESYIRSLYDSMIKRVADLKEAQGWNVPW